MSVVTAKLKSRTEKGNLMSEKAKQFYYDTALANARLVASVLAESRDSFDEKTLEFVAHYTQEAHRCLNKAMSEVAR